MNRDSEAFGALIDDLTLAIRHVEDQAERYHSMRRRADAVAPQDAEGQEMATAAVGFEIHNLYNAVENYFLRIAKFFENQLEGSTWHRDLVNRMATSAAGLRPPLLNAGELAPFHELRAFRHVFRVIYDDRLDPRRLALAEEQIAPALRSLGAAHTAYIEKLKEIRRALVDE